MRVHLCFLVLCLCTAVIICDKETEEEIHRKNIIDQLTKTRTVVVEGYDLVTRQIATDVYMYRSYRTVSVVFYRVERDVIDARFTFQAEELHLNNIGSCSPEEVVINLKHGSYPVVNPDGYPFPKNFLPAGQREAIHTIDILSDGRNTSYSVTNPKPGNWYALIYIKWVDPRTEKVEQQGLVANCQTILYTDLQVKKQDVTRLIDCSSGLALDYDQLPISFKCMSTDSIEPIAFNLSIANTLLAHDKVNFKIGSQTIPNAKSNLVNCAFDPKDFSEQIIYFTPHPNSWLYGVIDFTTDNGSQIADCESYHMRADEEVQLNQTVLDLMRDDKGRFFTFDYGLPTSDLQDATSLINITSNEVKSLRFKVNQFLDIGGSLAIETSLLMSLKYYMGYKRELKRGALLAFTEDNQYFRAVVCLGIGHATIPTAHGKCKYNDGVTPALFVLNSTDSESIYGKTTIPFPESGTWYLSFRVFCDDVVCPCRTSDNGTTYYVSESSNEDQSTETGVSWNNTREGTKECNASLVVSVSSTSCVSGRCSDHGNCLLNTFGGLVMSFCSCNDGYGGWDCSDDSRMDNMASLLVSVLLLTCSNFFFMFSIYVAIIRLYYTEAVMYTFTMLFSTFYHACDAPPAIAYCMFRGNILQFGDFYCGLMSFWVTLLAMSTIIDGQRSFFQLVGAILIALLTTWNMHSIYSFLLPVALGVLILLISWFLDYRKGHSMRYPTSYYAIYMPIGLVLVCIGLICYAFLQTTQNYKIVHSLWHIVIALGVVFLLPDVNRNSAVNPFVPSPTFIRDVRTGFRLID